MALIPIEHEHRLTSAAQAAALFRALRDRRPLLRGLQTTAPKRFELLVGALHAGWEHSIAFEHGNLGHDALAALEELAVQPFEYLDVRTTSACLRVWPDLRTWVYPLGPNGHAGELVETRTAAGAALEMFRELAGPLLVRGHISNIRDQTRVPLLRFLSCAAPTVSATHLVCDLANAQALTEAYPGERVEWQADILGVSFPEGRIGGYLKTPKIDERHRARWLRKVSRALRRAGLIDLEQRD